MDFEIASDALFLFLRVMLFFLISRMHMSCRGEVVFLETLNQSSVIVIFKFRTLMSKG